MKTEFPAVAVRRWNSSLLINTCLISTAKIIKYISLLKISKGFLNL